MTGPLRAPWKGLREGAVTAVRGGRLPTLPRDHGSAGPPISSHGGLTSCVSHPLTGGPAFSVRIVTGGVAGSGRRVEAPPRDVRNSFCATLV